MSEKRFIIDEEGIADTTQDKWYCWKEEFVVLLNSLQEETNQLKEERDYWKAKYDEGTETFESTLAEENEQLKKQVDNLQEAIAEICATLIMEGIEIEFDGKNLSELIDSE